MYGVRYRQKVRIKLYSALIVNRKGTENNHNPLLENGVILVPRRSKNRMRYKYYSQEKQWDGRIVSYNTEKNRILSENMKV